MAALDPEGYLRDLFQVLAHWPRPATSSSPPNTGPTRARLDASEMAAEIGLLTVPPPLPMPSGEQVAAD